MAEIKTTEEIQEIARDLQVRLDALHMETDNMQKLMKQRTEDVMYNQQVLDALDFVQFARRLYLPKGETTIYDLILSEMEKDKKGQLKEIHLHALPREKS